MPKSYVYVPAAHERLQVLVNAEAAVDQDLHTASAAGRDRGLRRDGEFPGCEVVY
jgi:hypothetical protein